MATRPTSSSTRPAPSTSGVRRNLFHHHLSRRPTASSTATSASTVQASAEDHSADIVIRDRNGEYQVEVPVMPVESKEEEEVVDKEKEEARLTDAVKHHCRDRNRTPSEPAELFSAVQASLRNKVESLEEDRWMYEAEQEERS